MILFVDVAIATRKQVHRGEKHALRESLWKLPEVSRSALEGSGPVESTDCPEIQQTPKSKSLLNLSKATTNMHYHEDRVLEVIYIWERDKHRVQGCGYSWWIGEPHKVLSDLLPGSLWPASPTAFGWAWTHDFDPLGIYPLHFYFLAFSPCLPVKEMTSLDVLIN